MVLSTSSDLPALYGVPPKHVVLFKNTLLDSIPPLPEHRPIDDRPVQIVQVGRLSPEKNPLFSVNLLATLRSMGVSADLTVVGDGVLREQMETFALSQGVEDVNFVGWVEDRADLMATLGGMDILVIPSLSEGSPKVAVEAMALGVVVATWPINPTIEELVGHGRCGILSSSLDPVEWATKIKEVVEQELMSGLRATAHMRVADQTVSGLVRLITESYSRLDLPEAIS